MESGVRPKELLNDLRFAGNVESRKKRLGESFPQSFMVEADPLLPGAQLNHTAPHVLRHLLRGMVDSLALVQGGLLHCYVP